MKNTMLALIGLTLVTPGIAARKTIQQKLESAIEASRYDKVKSLMKRYEATKPSAQERKECMSFIAETAADVVVDRTESLSLYGNFSDIVTYKNKENARDLAIFGIGATALIYGLKKGYAAWSDYATGPGPRQNTSEYWAQVARKTGWCVLGSTLGTYLFIKGCKCTQQKKALESAKVIQEYIQERA